MSVPDHFTAKMKQGNLTIQHFIDLGIGGTKSKRPTKKFDKALETVYSTDLDQCEMLNKDIHVEVFYAINQDVECTNLLTALRTRSEFISSAKIHSARPPPTAQIAQ